MRYLLALMGLILFSLSLTHAQQAAEGMNWSEFLGTEENISKSDNFSEQEVVTVACTRVWQSYNICDTITNVALFDIVLGSGKTFMSARDNVKKLKCAKKEQCKVIHCYDISSEHREDKEDKEFKVSCNCYYKLYYLIYGNICGNLGKVNLKGFAEQDDWTNAIVDAEMACFEKRKEQNISDSAFVGVHDCAIY